MSPQAAEAQIEVQIDEQFQTRASPEPLRQAALATLTRQQVEGVCELTVVVTGDDVLHDLNRRHRDVDAPTDVLAFPDATRGPFVAAPGLPRYLGDVIVSFPRASAQAAEAGHDTQAELQLLVVHGVLHLLGYDDVTEEQRARMWDAQSEILQALGVEAHPPLSNTR
ncbi:MAG: rRNA maturation RNase YbeY [Chloroflexi bacterium]|nr:rRNA maturation RNase YbeY [Chloroflexota bacterium]